MEAAGRAVVAAVLLREFAARGTPGRARRGRTRTQRRRRLGAGAGAAPARCAGLGDVASPATPAPLTASGRRARAGRGRARGGARRPVAHWACWSMRSSGPAPAGRRARPPPRCSSGCSTSTFPSLAIDGPTGVDLGSGRGARRHPRRSHRDLRRVPSRASPRARRGRATWSWSTSATRPPSRAGPLLVTDDVRRRAAPAAPRRRSQGRARHGSS